MEKASGGAETPVDQERANGYALRRAWEADSAAGGGDTVAYHVGVSGG